MDDITYDPIYSKLSNAFCEYSMKKRKLSKVKTILSTWIKKARFSSDRASVAQLGLTYTNLLIIREEYVRAENWVEKLLQTIEDVKNDSPEDYEIDQELYKCHCALLAKQSEVSMRRGNLNKEPIIEASKMIGEIDNSKALQIQLASTISEMNKLHKRRKVDPALRFSYDKQRGSSKIDKSTSGIRKHRRNASPMFRIQKTESPNRLNKSVALKRNNLIESSVNVEESDILINSSEEGMMKKIVDGWKSNIAEYNLFVGKIQATKRTQALLKIKSRLSSMLKEVEQEQIEMQGLQSHLRIMEEKLGYSKDIKQTDKPTMQNLKRNSEDETCPPISKRSQPKNIRVPVLEKQDTLEPRMLNDAEYMNPRSPVVNLQSHAPSLASPTKLSSNGRSKNSFTDQKSSGGCNTLIEIDKRINEVGPVETGHLAFLKVFYRIKKYIMHDCNPIIFERRVFNYGIFMKIKLNISMSSEMVTTLRLNCILQDNSIQEMEFSENKFILICLRVIDHYEIDVTDLPFRQFLRQYFFPYIKVRLKLIDKDNRK